MYVMKERACLQGWKSAPIFSVAPMTTHSVYGTNVTLSLRLRFRTKKFNSCLPDVVDSRAMAAGVRVAEERPPLSTQTISIPVRTFLLHPFPGLAAAHEALGAGDVDFRAVLLQFEARIGRLAVRRAEDCAAGPFIVIFRQSPEDRHAGKRLILPVALEGRTDRLAIIQHSTMVPVSVPSVSVISTTVFGAPVSGSNVRHLPVGAPLSAIAGIAGRAGRLARGLS